MSRIEMRSLLLKSSSQQRVIKTRCKKGRGYPYDAEGNRSKKTIAGTNSPLITKYLHDGLNPIRELDSAGAVQADLISAGLDNIISRIQNPATTPARRDFITDHLGSTIALTDETGTVKTTYSYDPYGKTVASGEVSSNPFQYTGRENDNVGIGQDSAAGLYYYRARYYSPLAHRFVQTDPIGLDGGINTFAYVEGDPISYTDPYGLAIMDRNRQLLEGGGGGGSLGFSSSGARHEAMRQANIPTSQQPVSQFRNSSGREYSYDVTVPGGSTIRMSVQQQTMDRSHIGLPHWEAGRAKIDPLTGQVRFNDYGFPRLTNDKTKICY